MKARQVLRIYFHGHSGSLPRAIESKPLIRLGHLSAAMTEDSIDAKKTHSVRTYFCRPLNPKGEMIVKKSLPIMLDSSDIQHEGTNLTHNRGDEVACRWLKPDENRLQGWASSINQRLDIYSLTCCCQIIERLETIDRVPTWRFFQIDQHEPMNIWAPYRQQLQHTSPPSN